MEVDRRIAVTLTPRESCPPPLPASIRLNCGGELSLLLYYRKLFNDASVGLLAQYGYSRGIGNSNCVRYFEMEAMFKSYLTWHAQDYWHIDKKRCYRRPFCIHLHARFDMLLKYLRSSLDISILFMYPCKVHRNIRENFTMTDPLVRQFDIFFIIFNWRTSGL